MLSMLMVGALHGWGAGLINGLGDLVVIMLWVGFFLVLVWLYAEAVIGAFEFNLHPYRWLLLFGGAMVLLMAALVANVAGFAGALMMVTLAFFVWTLYRLRVPHLRGQRGGHPQRRGAGLPG